MERPIIEQALQATRQVAQSTRPRVSVIMNCLDCEKYLVEAIDCVFAQTYSDWEIVLWDNASKQDIAAIARRYPDPRMRYFRGDATVPLGQARNLAIEQARGELIAFLDCDDLWLPRKLELQVPLFDDAEVDLAYCDVESFNTRGQVKRLGAKKRFARGRCFGELLDDYFLVLSSVVVRRAALDRQRVRFQERYDMVEEVDVFMRLAHAGKIDFVDQVLAKWRVHASSGIWTKFHLLADETEDMLAQFRREWPDASREYEREFYSRDVWVVRQRAVALWMKGEARAMRAALRNSPIRLPLKVRLLYFASWFSAKRWVPVAYRLLGANIAP